MPPDARAELEYALGRVEAQLARASVTCAALSAADSASEIRALAMRAESDEARLIESDNALGTARDAWAEAEAAAALKVAREQLRPLVAVLAALLEAGAQEGESLDALSDLANALDAQPKPDPESDAGKLARRIVAATAALDGTFAQFSHGRRGGYAA